MLGELGFNQSGGPLMFNHPKGIATDGTVLLMADGNNNRVLLWDDLPTSNTEPTIVFGQQDFDTNNSGESETELSLLADVAVGGESICSQLYTYNHRILIWNELPSTNASSPDLILTSTEYDDSPYVIPNVNQFALPWGVWTDGEKLIVASTSSGSANGRHPIWRMGPDLEQALPLLTSRQTLYSLQTERWEHREVSQQTARASDWSGTTMPKVNLLKAASL